MKVTRPVQKRILVAMASVLLLFGCSNDANELPESGSAESGLDTTRPNVLLIAVDDLNDWVGYTGTHPDTRTPHIDALAKRGTAFTRTFSQYPLCGPSRASLFAGLLPGTLEIFDHPRPDTRVVEAAQKHNTVLLHSFFRQHGYKTMAVGKLLHRHVPEGSVDLSGGRGNWGRLPDGKRLNFSADHTMTD